MNPFSMKRIETGHIPKDMKTFLEPFLNDGYTIVDMEVKKEEKFNTAEALVFMAIEDRNKFVSFACIKIGMRDENNVFPIHFFSETDCPGVILTSAFLLEKASPLPISAKEAEVILYQQRLAAIANAQYEMLQSKKVCRAAQWRQMCRDIIHGEPVPDKALPMNNRPVHFFEKEYAYLRA